MKRIYGWMAALVVLLAMTPVSTMKAQASGTAGAPQKSVSQKIADSKTLMDINTATLDQLKSLPGIGDVYAKRIVDGRPYSAKTQLVQKGVIPQATYEKIKDQIIAHRVKK